ncbi:MAG: PilN domain-containing protein [Thermodesulfovibrionales bacterium]|nr:PilN domain-containing protein [Thermodesulfovibrionales bacterium]
MKKTLNLLPAGKKERIARGMAFYAGAGILLYLAVICGLWAYNLSEAKSIRAAIDETDKKVAGLRSQIVGLPLPEPIVTPEGQGIAVKLGQTPPWDMVLWELSHITPEKVWLSLIDIKDSGGGISMSIKGFSKTQVAVADFIGGLEESRYFSDVEVVFSQKGETDAVFELRVKIKWI